jgi:hypothetical protein
MELSFWGLLTTFYAKAKDEFLSTDLADPG